MSLSLAELERLAILNEELAEAQQIISKIIRHGYNSHHPADRERTTNRVLLEKELGDVYQAMRMLEQAKDVNGEAVLRNADDKAKRIIPYLHHQPSKPPQPPYTARLPESRGSGRTTNALLDAPFRAYYVVHTQTMAAYVTDLARDIGRPDITVVSKDIIERLRGLSRRIVVDHATELTYEQWNAVWEFNFRAAKIEIDRGVTP